MGFRRGGPAAAVEADGDQEIDTDQLETNIGGITETATLTTAAGSLNAMLRQLKNIVYGAVGGVAKAAGITVTMATDDPMYLLAKTTKPATGATTSVASGTGVQTILASNASRIGASVFNDDANVLYLLLGAGTVSSSVYTVQVPSSGYYEVPFGFTGILTGLWGADGSGSARVTEITA